MSQKTNIHSATLFIYEDADISISSAIDFCLHIGGVTIFFDSDEKDKGLEKLKKLIDTAQELYDRQGTREQDETNS